MIPMLIFGSPLISFQKMTEESYFVSWGAKRTVRSYTTPNNGKNLLGILSGGIQMNNKNMGTDKFGTSGSFNSA